MVKGARQFFTCPSCSKRFTYWILESNPHPKVKCYYCAKESFPMGEPPAAPAPSPEAAPKPPAPPAPTAPPTPSSPPSA
jgi:hypothetical protein